jgi:glutamate-5-semialdehyde dehydrogenase
MGELAQSKKTEVLLALGEALLERCEEVVLANERDVKGAEDRGMNRGLVDRLLLNRERIKNISESVVKIAKLPDPVGEIIGGRKLPNGLEISKKRVPLGVVACIYEARPNVTVDVFSMCFKTSNAVILKGGSAAFETNKKIVEIVRSVLQKSNIPTECVGLVEDTSHATTTKLIKLNEYIDVLIPRGGAELIRNVVENSTIPIIETGTGNCHIFVDETADLDMAISIINNAKTSRVGVCNTCESLVIHENIKDKLLPPLVEGLPNVEIRINSTEKDWATEYLDYILSVKIVRNIDEAIVHINRYSTHHSEAIITQNYDNARKFLDGVDSACVYVNASTRFSDGGEFGFGTEVGISTQKLHTRGPMGLEALTTYKYIIYGNGQIRN